MNERIKELIEQSGAGDVTPKGMHHYLENLAELIVRESANLVDDWEMYQAFTSHQIHGFMPPIGGSKKLKEHFGVE